MRSVAERMTRTAGPRFRRALVAWSSGVLVVALSLVAGPVPRAAAAGSILYVNNDNFGTLGTCVPGNNFYDPNIPANNKCSLGAALTLANINSSLAAPWTVTVAYDYVLADGGDIMPGNATPSTPNGFMTGAAINPLALPGAYYTISAPMTVDLMNRLAILIFGEYDYTALYIDSSNVNLLGASYIQSGMTGIVVSNRANNVTIDGGMTLPIYGYWPRQFLVVQNGAKNITFRNYYLGNFNPGAADNCGGAAVCFHPGLTPGSTTTNVVIDNVTFTSTASASNTLCDTSNSWGCVSNSIVLANAQTSVAGLTVSNSTFSNLKKGNYQDAVVLSAKAPSTLSNLTFRDNTITDSGSCPTLTSQSCSLIQLPNGQTMGGTNSIRNNTFTNDPALGQPHAITWQGAQSGTTPSNLTIESNSFDGFAGPAVWLDKTGTTTVQYNTFGPNTYSNTGTAVNIGEETGVNATGALGGMFTNGSTASNQKINTWYPTSANIGLQAGVCTAYVNVAPPTVSPIPAAPVAIDMYWTATNKAERFLGRTTGVMGATTVSFPVPPDLLDANMAMTGNLRIQTQSLGTGLTQSSQYSRTISPALTCTAPDFTVQKIAYSDSARTIVLPAGSVLPLGTTVYFSYVLTNLNPVSSTVITAVTDDRKTDGPVCTNVTLAPSQIDSTSCRWQQAVTR